MEPLEVAGCRLNHSVYQLQSLRTRTFICVINEVNGNILCELN